MPQGRACRRAPARAQLRMNATDHLMDVVKDLPQSGESIHIVSGARFDFWTWVPAILKRSGPAAHFYCSTWTLSRNNAIQMFEMWDAKQIEAVDFLTGAYFKRRETAVYSLLLEGITKRGGRYRAFQNHAKVMLLELRSGEHLVIEGSANLTSNPRFEQYVFSNDADLYRFHQQWMEEVFVATDTRKPRQEKRNTPRGFVHPCAGDGVRAWTNRPADRRATICCKLSPRQYPQIENQMAEAIVQLIRDTLPQLPERSFVTAPPQGTTFPGHYLADRLARAVANAIGRPYDRALAPASGTALQIPIEAQTGSTCLVVDDMIRSGATMRLAVDTLRQAGLTVYGFAYNG